MQKASDVRKSLVDFLYRDLIGPAHGPNEILLERPTLRYSAGILFPRESATSESSEFAGTLADDVSNSDSEEPVDPPSTAESPSPDVEVDNQDDAEEVITLANSYKPSAMGLSFVVSQPYDSITVSVSAACYTQHEAENQGSSQKVWKRKQLELESKVFEIPDRSLSVQRWTPAEGLQVQVRFRASVQSKVRYATVSVCNTTQGEGRDENAFFQVRLSVERQNGASFQEYRENPRISRDDEELGLELLYHTRKTYAIGHGCAADWDRIDGEVRVVRSAVIPSVSIPPVIPRQSAEDYLSMQFLSGNSGVGDEQVVSGLRQLPARYGDWIDEIESKIETLPEHLIPIARSHVARCRVAQNRISCGIDVLSDDPDSLQAFRMMNRAMLRQQVHSKFRRRLDDKMTNLEISYSSVNESGCVRGFWRDFQLAFVLLTLPGLVEEHDTMVDVVSNDGEAGQVISRDVVDLIWFPTGGGKTEAYFGVAAFAIFRRRLRDPRSDGCVVLMRYTLRLLTSQQFQRAASLICACELLRREDESLLGKSPLELGLWVGGSLSPNRSQDALKAVRKLGKSDPNQKNPFQLLSCPWCGTELANSKRLGYVEVAGRQIFRCPSTASDGRPACPFSDATDQIPVVVVDDYIYQRPPAMVVGTVDKFAQLAWRSDAGALLGGAGRRPPELIIQDELHLIEGPLGSMVGLYEAVIELLCRKDRAVGPKYIASTATVRRAEDQVYQLYGRRVAQFPPPGISVGDSYFAREGEDKASSRVYVGVLPTAASSALTGQVRTVAALTQGLKICTPSDLPHALLDPYWTLVQYFSSLKELGRAATLVTGDVPEYLPTMRKRYDLAQDRYRWLNRMEELTSRKNEDEIPKILADLEVRLGSDAKSPLDTLLATNMISVGVDVQRLGLMMMVTQPKSTSEYIQASSRVGRNTDAPGVVVTLFNGSRPRDRSHYEKFRGFHESFYRFVEPSSVTPFSLPAMERALHALIIIAARHIDDLDEPADFDPGSEGQEQLSTFLLERISRLDQSHADELRYLLSKARDEWQRMKPQEWGRQGPQDLDSRPLMRPAGFIPERPEKAWQTPTSLRSVDVECEARIVRYL